MSYNSLKVFENFIGHVKRFKVTYISPKFDDIFYAEIKEVHEHYIIVEQKYMKSDEDYNEELVSQKRKLGKRDFKVLDDK